MDLLRWIVHCFCQRIFNGPRRSLFIPLLNCNHDRQFSFKEAKFFSDPLQNGIEMIASLRATNNNFVSSKFLMIKFIKLFLLRVNWYVECGTRAHFQWKIIILICITNRGNDFVVNMVKEKNYSCRSCRCRHRNRHNCGDSIEANFEISISYC